jgi:hypothetical protein
MRLEPFLAAVVVACSGSSSTGTTTIEQACADAASAACQRYQSCSAALVTFEFGDVGTCQTRVSTQCRTRLAAPDEASTPNTLEACVAKFPQVACDKLFSNDPPSECLPPAGTRAQGAACGDDSQCQSAFCGIDTNKVCGTCQSAPAAGAACIGQRCVPGLVCDAQTKCVKPGAIDSACDSASPCTPGLVCFRRKCVAAPGQGAPCDPAGISDPTCDLSQGLYCDPTSHTCKQAAFGNAGDPCGIVDSTYRACSGSTYCNASSALGKGTCQPKAADGAACSTDVSKGAPCLAPAVCNNGTCTLGDPAACH